MKSDKFIKVLLIVISLLLILNLFKGTSRITDANAQTVIKEAQDLTKLHLKDLQVDRVVSIACSNDGKIVFIGTANEVYRSSSYGKAGSWTIVAR